MQAAPGKDDPMMLVSLLCHFYWVSVYSNLLIKGQRRNMGIFYSCHYLEEFFDETIEHNVIAISAESSSLYRVTLASIPNENGETCWFKLVLQRPSTAALLWRKSIDVSQQINTNKNILLSFAEFPPLLRNKMVKRNSLPLEPTELDLMMSHLFQTYILTLDIPNYINNRR